MKEQTRLYILNSVLGKQCNAAEAAHLIGVSERQLWRLLTAYRKEGATALAHGNRGRQPRNVTSVTIRERIVALVAELRLANAGTLAEANDILESFLHRFNQQLVIPAAQPELSYRPVDPGLDIDAVLCNKEMRRVAKDNTVQYYGKTLQLFPGDDRPSYAGARVEVQERLDEMMVELGRGRNTILNKATKGKWHRPEKAKKPKLRAT